MEKWEHAHTAGRDAKWAAAVANRLVAPRKGQRGVPSWPSSPTPRVYPRTAHTHTGPSGQIFLTARFIAARRWEQPGVHQQMNRYTQRGPSTHVAQPWKGVELWQTLCTLTTWRLVRGTRHRRPHGVWSHFCEMPRTGKFTDRKWVYGCWRNGESLLMDIELHFGVMKAFRNYLGVTVVKRYKNTKDH